MVVVRVRSTNRTFKMELFESHARPSLFQLIVRYIYEIKGRERIGDDGYYYYYYVNRTRPRNDRFITSSARIGRHFVKPFAESTPRLKRDGFFFKRRTPRKRTKTVCRYLRA